MPADCCPVCENDPGFTPWTDAGPSFEICPHCGIQFGYNDVRADLRDQIYKEWRAAWIEHDRKPFEGEEWRELSVRVGRIVGFGKGRGTRENAD